MTKAIDALLKRTRNVTYFFALGAGENPCTEINKSKYTSACMYTCRRMNLFKSHVHVYVCMCVGEGCRMMHQLHVYACM